MRHARQGFTIIEVVIAAFIFAVGVLALEATAAGALREMRRSASVSLAASLAGSRLGKLAATRCDAMRGGTDTLQGFVSTWTVGAVGADFRVIDQTVRYKVSGEERADVYRSAVPCR